VELLKRMKSSKPNVIIFMLTAFISNELIEQAKREGADKVLSKFIWPDEILKHIKEVV
jgi:DNA-binding NarL/FixJ family response regulator